ncbi:MAG: hypothetical protein ABF322_05495 [Lentimonas sp.]
MRKEPAFSVYSALETSAATNVIEPLKSVIGIENWLVVQVPIESIQ